MTNKEKFIEIFGEELPARKCVSKSWWEQEYEPPALEQEYMVEIDLYSVIKQKYIERDVLDKIRAEITQMPTISFNANDIYKADVLAIIDKYKAESEERNDRE